MEKRINEIDKRSLMNREDFQGYKVDADEKFSNFK